MNFGIHEQNMVRNALGAAVLKSYDSHENFYIKIRQSSLIRSMSILRSDSNLRFSSLVDCFAVDFLAKSKVFSIYYQMLSYQLNQSLFVSIDLNENDILPSLTILFQNANWYEREIFDMFGIVFHDHPDMRRILTNHDFSSFPLLKNFLL